MTQPIDAKRPKIILHIGAPKCGSSTLQAALSASPTLVAQDGGTLAYSGLSGGDAGWKPIEGTTLKRNSDRSVTGYICCPNFAHNTDHTKIAKGLDRIYQTARSDWTPVMSQEGWYDRADTFAALLPHWFAPSQTAPQIEVVAYVRPHLDWLNSAFWQWGVWSHKTWDVWREKSLIEFRMGACLKQWAALPNVTLRLQMGGDVIDAFNQQYGVSLMRQRTRNTTQTPAMIGFMQRMPQFRTSAHDVLAEFTVQRWCDTDGARRPWVLRPRDVAAVQDARLEDVKTLVSLLPAEDRDAVLSSDRRWTEIAPYYDVLARGRSDLTDVAQMTDFYASLCDGVKRAAAAVQRPVKPMVAARLKQPMSDIQTLSQLDDAAGQMLDALIRLDETHRLGVLGGLKKRLLPRLPFKR